MSRKRWIVACAALVVATGSVRGAWGTVAGRATGATAPAVVATAPAPQVTGVTTGDGWAQVSFTPPVYAVTMPGFAYAPNPLTVPAASMVKWTNTGSFSHTVTASNGAFDSSPSCPTSGCMGSGATYSQVFTTPGTVDYYCTLHGTSAGVGMAAKVIVTDGSDGSAVTGYTVTLSPSGRTVTVPAGSKHAVFTGLTNGVAQTATVRAINAAGPGTVSAASASFTPLAAALNVTSSYDTAGATRLQMNATFFGASTQNAQRTSVQAVAFLVGLTGDSTVTPYSPPAITVASTVTTSWSTADQPALTTVMAKFGLTPGQAQAVSVAAVGFLLALQGH